MDILTIYATGDAKEPEDACVNPNGDTVTVGSDQEGLYSINVYSLSRYDHAYAVIDRDELKRIAEALNAELARTEQ